MDDLDLQGLHCGKTEESNLVEKEKIRIGKTTTEEHISTSVQLKENKENKEDYKASMVQVVEPLIRKQTMNKEDGIVCETADNKELAGQHGERKIQVSKKICRKKIPEKVQWIRSLTSIQTSKLIIWIILGFLFPGFAGSVHYHEKCTGIDLKVTSKENFIEGGSATFIIPKKCTKYDMTAAPNGKVLSIVTDRNVEDDYLNLVTSEVSSSGWTITIKTLTSSNLTTVYEFTCGFKCEQTKRLSQYRKENGANGITYNILLIWLCCLLTCLSWIMH
ncbi:uncharacterized protein LOC143080506 [Mytilus galloprovincialis]|uniref:uncharacterized protein LOC143080506 n=1 Tax=Mytilus galloprovincialis TaxID=29158 RepID=UPI003F7C50A6